MAIDRELTPREQQVVDFFAAWGQSFDAMCASFEGLMAPDCVWDQRPIPVIVGPEAAVASIRTSRRTLLMETVDVDMVHIASDRDVVHTERVDHLRRADGSLIGSAPVVGVMTFDGDRVVHWREYFDLAGFVVQALRSSVAFAGRQVLGAPGRILGR
jgi:limonene-1,2-epoxide hydrolase